MLPDKNKKTGESNSTAAEPNRTPAEVRQLLNVIAGQIASADFKTSANFDDIKSRLVQLQHQAQTAKAEASGELAGEFERIEASLAELTTLIPEWGTEAADVASAPAALRSAASGWAGTARSSGSKADPFDIVDNGVATPDSADWSQSEAEQLTRVYEEANFKDALHRPASASIAVPSQPVQSATAAAAVAHSKETIPHSTISQPWLEDRFSEIAAGLQHILDETHPSVTIAALDERLSKLETHLTSVFQSTGGHSDAEALRQIENYISDVARQFEKAQGQFGRIENIETQLNAVVDHLAAQLELQPETAPQLAGADLQRLVEDAAEMTAQRFASAQSLAAVGQDRGQDGGIDSLKDLLEGYISERRQGEEHNSLMLDTVQQALIRVLDRMDTLETSHEKAVSQLISKPHAPTPYSQPLSAPEAKDPPNGFERRANPERRAPEFSDYQAATTAPIAAAPLRPSIPVAPEPVKTPELAQARNSTDKLRQDFVADAQRGRQRAAAMRSSDPAFIEEPAFDDQLDAMDIPRGRMGAPLNDGATAEASPIRMPSRKFLVAAAAAILVLLGSVSLMKSSIPEPSDSAMGTPQIESTEAPAANASGASAKQTAPSANGATQQIMPGGAAPSAAPAPHSSLQFDNDDPATGDASSATVSDTTTTIPGLRVRAPDNTQSAADIVLLRQQQKLAELSNQVGETAANMMTPAAFMQDVPLTKVPTAVTATAAQGTSSALDLPPVTVGPLSLRLAAGKGDPSAEFEAGSRLAEGKGTGQDFKEAMRWYQRSASKGFAQAQYRLGTMYERGLGIKADLGMARNWYQRAAEQGNIKAMHNLAVLSAGRQNGNPDYATASKWFTDAATRDLKDSQYNLAVLYENGLGVEKNLKQAAKWFSLAARSGDAESVRRRDILKAQLTTEDQSVLAQDIATYKPIFEKNLVINDARAAGEDWKKRANADETQPATAPAEPQS